MNMTKSAKHQAVKGVVWSAVERFSVQGIQFILSIIIARLIAPSEYGLIAMLSIFLAVAQSFIDSGFSNALIQKKNRTEIDCSTVFYFNTVISVLVYLLLFLLAPYIADFYREPQLEIITKWVGLGLIMSGLSIVQRAKLTIDLNFKVQAQASLAAVIISGIIGIILAYCDFGVWALVFQALLNNGLNTLLLWLFACWRPSWIFSWKSFHSLFSFGSKLLIGGILHTVYKHLYSLVIGRWYSASNVGYYNRAQSMAVFPSGNVVGVISRAMYPIFCQLQDNEEQLETSFIKCVRFSCFLIFPLMTGCAVLSTPLIQLLLTDKWLPASELLFILCLAYMWDPVMYFCWLILSVRGRTDLSLKSEVIKKMVSIVILLVSIPWGIRVMCYGVLLYSICDIIIISFFVRKILPISLSKVAKELLPLLSISLVMGGGMYVAISFFSSPWIKLLVGAFVGGGTLIFCSSLFRFPEYEYVKLQIKNKLNIYK
jgi:O-antigen/teichoic acid export membrane protein